MRKCDRFFKAMEAQCLAVTFGDVRLKTGHAEVLPDSVSLASRFSKRVSLKIPIVSAAMDTVTESPLAIAIAKLGGLGIIHRNLTPDRQKEEAMRTKFHLSGKIEGPITVLERMTVREVQNMRKDRNFSFHTFPVMDDNGKWTGLITQNDFDFCDDLDRPVVDIMTKVKELIIAPPSITIEEAFRIMQLRKKKVLPLVDNENQLKGMYLWNDVSRVKLGMSAEMNVDRNGRLAVGAAVGTGEDALKRAEKLSGYVDVIVVDSAHGDSDPVIETVRTLKRLYDDIDIVAGNISEGESVFRLVDAGADGIKVGQGPGSICTTRVVAGIGCPQVTAIYNAVRALERTGIPVCADGGIENSGDITVAIGAGAHSVMLGKLLAGVEEAPGEVLFLNGQRMKYYRGMGSLAAMQESHGSRERYGQAGIAPQKLVPEGVEGAVTYLGDLATVMTQYTGGLRAGLGYAGAADIEELREKADFYRITKAGIDESHPHVDMLHDEVNYRKQK